MSTIYIAVKGLCWGGVFFLLGLLVAQSDWGGDLAERSSQSLYATRHSALSAAADLAGVDVGTRIFIENPELAVALGDGFGGEFSVEVALNMFGANHEPAIADVRTMTQVEEVAPRTWLIRMPIVNAVLFETDAGNVLVDTGMAPAGPALIEKIREVSDKPLHTIIYTHGHVDHAYGTPGILEGGAAPVQILAHEAILPRFDRYIRLRHSIAGYMNQKPDQMPESREDLVLPTRTFSDRLEFELGGETFVLQHHLAETDDQLYVWAPDRGVLASADYYQGFLPNAGNGKRVQRDPEAWAAALREMMALEPAILLPGHGEAIVDPEQIQQALGVHAAALQSIVDQTIDGLNAGLRKDEIFAAVELPENLAGHPLLNIQDVSAQDISKMVLKQYTGWWNDVPSDWSPATLPEQGREIVELAGGMAALTERARELSVSNLPLASHLADWAFFADPDSALAQQVVLDVYRARILAPETNTQEALAYRDQMVEARTRQLAVEQSTR